MRTIIVNNNNHNNNKYNHLPNKALIMAKAKSNTSFIHPNYEDITLSNNNQHKHHSH